MYLVLDTTKDKSIIALFNPKKDVLHIMRQTFDRSHSKLLLTRIDSMLKKHAMQKEAVKGIVCVTGPGSYTGSRVGVATANALSFGLGIPLFGISKFDIVPIFFPDFDGLVAIPSYQMHYLVRDVVQNSEKMVSEGVLQKTSRAILLIDQETSKGHTHEFLCTTIDYQLKKHVYQWAYYATHQKPESSLRPYYFKEANITPKVGATSKTKKV